MGNIPSLCINAVRLSYNNDMLRVLFVCMGNICRSPSAEGVFLKLVADSGLSRRVEVRSAGTHDYHVGGPSDPRSHEAASRRGVHLSHHRAQQVQAEDFKRYDYILAMDRVNMERLLQLCPAEHAHKVRLFLEFADASPDEEVPDPYYGGPNGFEHVLNLIELASGGLLADIRQNLIHKGH